LQALPAVKNGDYIIMVKVLEDGSKAVGLFNLTKGDMKIIVPWEILKIIGKQNIRDIWRQKNLGVFDNKFESEVPPHGVVLVKISN
jgi:alpha-galactosidase